jgi:hypothetical protein
VKSMRHVRTVLLGLGMVAVFSLLITGCETLKWRKGSSESTSATAKAVGTAPLYYDFEDVLIPGELKVNRKESFVYQTHGFSAGVLVLDGRVEASSLIAFFDSNMAKDNWKPLSKFASQRSILLYQKENRYCMINIFDKDFKTHVEIWVAPMREEAESALMK